MGLSTAPQLRFLKRQGRGAKSVPADEQETATQPAAGVKRQSQYHRLWRKWAFARQSRTGPHVSGPEWRPDANNSRSKTWALL